MKKLTFILLMFLSVTAFAKKVKFAVDMSFFEVSPNGVHVTGNFQVLAGYPEDWDPGSTTMEREGETDIYSIVVDLPAYELYQFRFINGDQFYETEFVPLESRVGYDFNDNRWIYVDSLANDTTFVGAITFGGNAPAGMNLVRFLVNLEREAEIAPEGVHIAGDFQGWEPTSTRLYNFVDQIYETICFVYPGTYEYKYYNGNTPEAAEIITGDCTVNGNRQIEVEEEEDIVLEPICFGWCVDCLYVGISDPVINGSLRIFPNPVSTTLEIDLRSDLKSKVTIYNTIGEIVMSRTLKPDIKPVLDVSSLGKGLYILSVKQDDFSATTKLIIK